MSLTLGDFIDNMEENGFPKLRGRLYAYAIVNDVEFFDIVKGGCALGQACWNTFGLYLSPSDNLFRILDGFHSDDGQKRFSKYIVDLNDDTDEPISEIAKMARRDFSKSLDKVILI